MKRKLKFLTVVLLIPAILAMVFFLDTATISADWAYEQDFEGLSTGDLNTQDSWSGDVSYDVQTSVVQEGSQAVSATTGTMTRAITAITDTGRMSIRIRVTAGNNAGVIDLFDGTSNAVAIGFGVDDVTTIEALTGGVWTNVQNFSVDTWYKIELDFDVSADTYVISVDDGADSDAIAFENNITQVDTIRFRNISIGTYYFDNIVNEDAAGGGGAADDGILSAPTFFFQDV